jgi:hypothetical protein
VKSFDDEFLVFLKRIGLDHLSDAEVEDLKNLFVVLLNPDVLPAEEPVPDEDEEHETARPVFPVRRRPTSKTTKKTTTCNQTTTKKTTTTRGKLSVLNFK